MSHWQPIETAPKGGGAELVTDPKWVEPPLVLLFFPNGQQQLVVCKWDWYYAEGGHGYNGAPAWIEPTSGEQAAMHYDEPTHWMLLPDVPEY